MRMGGGPEFDLIRELLREGGASPLPEGVLVGPGDDCAVIVGDGIVLSSDLSIEGVHFRRAWLSIEEIGYRAVAAALSDLAAVAARPIGILVSMALPADEASALVPGLRSGIAEACRLVDAIVLGGDLSRAPGGIVLDVTVVGEASRPILRSGALEGDALWVTGYLGGSGAAVRAWEAGEVPASAARLSFVRPVPRTREALWLRERGALNALIDLSDGLAADAGHIAAASDVGIRLEREAIPIHSAAAALGTSASEPRSGPALEMALGGGEDYELCFSAPAGRIESLQDEFRARFGIPLTRVGTVREGQGDVVLGSSRGASSDVPLTSVGYSHFKEGEQGT